MASEGVLSIPMIDSWTISTTIQSENRPERQCGASKPEAFARDLFTEKARFDGPHGWVFLKSIQ
jgi:hypothetical protein